MASPRGALSEVNKIDPVVSPDNASTVPFTEEESFEFIYPAGQKLSNMSGDEQVAALEPAPEPKDAKSEERYNSIEHMLAADTAFGKFLNDPNNPKDQNFMIAYRALGNKIKLDNPGIALTIGNIVCLAGDFYGVPGKPICAGDDTKRGDTKADRFIEAYKSLVIAEQDEVEDFINRIWKTGEKIVAGFKHKQKPSVSLRKDGFAADVDYVLICEKTVFPARMFSPKYVTLAEDDFDHFGDEAKIAYHTGYKLAVKTAQEAKNARDKGAPNEIELLMKSFGLIAFASHFLTDLFSAGHVRTPRMEIYKYVKNHNHIPHVAIGRKMLAGLLAKEQHDEDSREGVWVENDASIALDPDRRTWKSMGDNCYFEEDNKMNAEWMEKALLASFNDVYDVYTGDNRMPEELPSAFKFLPRAANHPKNFAPLFKPVEVKAADGTVHTDIEIRKQVKNRLCEAYKSGWSPTFTYAQRKTPGAGKQVVVKPDDFHLAEDPAYPKILQAANKLVQEADPTLKFRMS